MDLAAAHAQCTAVLETLESTISGDRLFFSTVLTGLLARGHVLLEDVPGTGKTLTARSIATILGISFSRIQFTPDLLPADVTGSHIFNEQTRSFEFDSGPIFNNVVLADEINRASPKTQSALLEAMEERQVTVAGETRPLPDPFFVIATQNPIDHEGTFSLPEAQVDRFMIKTSIGYPSTDGEITLLRRRKNRTHRSPSTEELLSIDRVTALQAVPETVRVADDILEYMVAITRNTRTDPRVHVGVSPRGTQRLFEAARAYAVVTGRDYVTPDIIKTIAKPVLAHRLVLTPDARVNEIDPGAIIDETLDTTLVPTVD